MKNVYYIAYGSNLDKERFFRRCPSAKVISISLLSDKALVFKGDDIEYSYLTLEDEIGNLVPIVIFEISYFDSLRLDKYEGYPMLYSKKWVTVEVDGNSINAMYYIMNSKYNYNLPSLSYFKSCLKGYEDFGFDKNYLVEALKRTNSRLSDNNGKVRK